MSQNLFNIQEEYYEILQQIEELEGEITPELEEALKINKENLEAKIKAYYYYIKQNEGNIKTIEDEIERLQTKIGSITNVNIRLKDKVKEALELFGDDGKSGNKTLKFTDLSIWNVYNKPLRLEIEDKDYIETYPESPFIKTKTVHSLDRTTMKKDVLDQDIYLEQMSAKYNMSIEDIIAKLKEIEELFTTQEIINDFSELYEPTMGFELEDIRFLIPDAKIDYSANYIRFK